MHHYMHMSGIQQRNELATQHLNQEFKVLNMLGDPPQFLVFVHTKGRLWRNKNQWHSLLATK